MNYLFMILEMFGLNNEISFSSQLNKLNTVCFPRGNASRHNYPESTDVLVDMIGTAAFSGVWRSGVAKYIVLMTDNKPAGDDDWFDTTDTATLAALAISLVAHNIKVA